MKLVNPLGRNLGGSSVQPLACFCTGNTPGYTDYNKGRGPSDNCARCGCYCDTLIGLQYNTDNYRGIAKIVDRKSPVS